MNKLFSTTFVSWRTRNKKKMARMETWCADYGLKPIQKAFHAGMLSERERRTLEHKFKRLLTGKLDRHCILVLCQTCTTSFDAEYNFIDITKPYEIV